ncbi:unnamed protein product [Rotaria sordida]|uniref:Uncharacterized protein n=1 Tax=Rotaria sordida TaxID=392033 RepID=A0A814NW76_9BILA|nr:unnamed protein product [Rotaria sordida]CAF1315746.1 unnamed protein product [Rotaria sordida]CAF3778691.1 unnamed protein product [Rotaria sordida]CAF3920517.1 unnamed protein product [Rotaria sordida]
MGCIFGCNQPYDDDDEISIEDNHHHRSDRHLGSYYSYCLYCRCQQYSQYETSSNQCFCRHSITQHKRI